MGGVDGDGVGFLLQVAELVAMAVAYAAGHGGDAFPEGLVDGVRKVQRDVENDMGLLAKGIFLQGDIPVVF